MDTSHTTPLRALFVALVMALGFAPMSGAQTVAQTLPLQTAAARGLVEYRFESIGGSTGDSIKVMVRLTSPARGPLRIAIPPGTVLRSGGAGQSMVVDQVRGIDVGGGFFKPASQIALSGSSWVAAILSAFCAEFEKDNPSADTRFELQLPDPTLACVLTRSRDLSLPAQQAAVWSVTDHVSFSHMNQKFEVSPAEWAAAQDVVRACAGR